MGLPKAEEEKKLGKQNTAPGIRLGAQKTNPWVPPPRWVCLLEPPDFVLFLLFFLIHFLDFFQFFLNFLITADIHYYISFKCTVQ